MLDLSILHASTRGFNQRCIIDACTDLNLTSAAHSIISPIELIHYAMKKWNKQAIETLQNDAKFQESRISDKIKILIRQRLMQQTSFINKWNEAMLLGGKPENSYKTSLILWQYADDGWYLAGDRSNDYNFYTKRILFLYSYITTELHMLTDKSNDFEQTWMFLDRRIDEVLSMGSNILFIKQMINTLSASGYYVFTMFQDFPQNKK